MERMQMESCCGGGATKINTDIRTSSIIKRKFVKFVAGSIYCTICNSTTHLCNICLIERSNHYENALQYAAHIYRSKGDYGHIEFADVKSHFAKHHPGNIFLKIVNEHYIEYGTIQINVSRVAAFIHDDKEMENGVAFIYAERIIKKWPQLLLVELCDPITAYLASQIDLNKYRCKACYSRTIAHASLPTVVNGFRTGPLNEKRELIEYSDLCEDCDGFDVICDVLASANYCCGQCDMEYDCGIPPIKIVTVHINEHYSELVCQTGVQT